ncbi:transmembrane protein 94-like [Glandiceps talaboti]
MSSQEKMGLSTREALKKLHTVIQGEIRSYQKEKNWKLEQVPHHCTSLSYQPYCTLHWTSATKLFLAAMLILVCYGAVNKPSNYQLVVEAIVIVLLLIINLYVSGSDKKLRRKEMQYQAEQLLRILQGCITSCSSWDEKLYPDLHTPLSRSVSMQWTYRDGSLVNLPCHLLVKDDVIALRPGQLVPAKVKEMQSPEDVEGLELEAGELYNPCTAEILKEVSDATAHEPMRPSQFKVLETPYAQILRKCLWHGTSKPVGLLENKRLVCNSLMERWILPLVLILSLLTNVIRFVFLKDDMGHWSTMFILLPVYSILPLLPLVVPVIWILSNVYGVAKLLSCFEKSKQSSKVLETLQTMEETDTLIKHEVSWLSVWRHFKAALFGKCETLTRTANIMQTLGTVTELSCVDKTGILSWPNPSVEKVFFFSSLPPEDSEDEDETEDDEEDEGDSEDREQRMDKVRIKGTKTHRTESKDNDSVFEESSHDDDCFPECHVEVLDLTEGHLGSVTGLQFDDPNWQRHLTSLKPMGLNILVNTCNMDAMEKRTEFIDHVTCIANQQNLPLVTRRCLCDLARLMGFSEQAGDAFELQQQLATYRKVPISAMQTESVHSVKVRKTMSFHKKYTLPHMMSVVVGGVNTINTDALQMLTEGTAEMVLDACTDFWDGADICPLTGNDRKKILDFYHRASLSAYCCAFAYRPLSQTITSGFGQSYIEMPTTESTSLPIHEIPSPVSSPVHNIIQSLNKKSRKSSGDSSYDRMHDIQDPDGVFRAQTGQIFIGMVAMQYQAKEDIVGLIENLDNACIRFVHFSPDNELKSKVFAEKVGLEVGWNCHVSLRSTETPPANQVTTQLGYTNKSSLVSLTKKKTQESNVVIDFDNMQVTFRDDKSKDDIEVSPEKKLKATQSLHVLSFSSDEETRDKLIHSKSVGDFPKSSPGDLMIDIEDETVTETTPLNPSSVQDRPQKVNSEGKVTSGKTSPDGAVSSTTQKDDLTILRSRHVSETCTFSTVTSEDYDEGLMNSLAESAFEITNRAKLPRGIGNIRPHIENVDNVPLLVPLFTDCTPDACREMIAIMQENGEIVCCLGSTANFYNTGIFLQADVSIGLEPLYPQVCQQYSEEEYLRHSSSSTKAQGLLPLDLSHLLATLPCSLTFHRDDKISIIDIVKEARSLTQALINCFIFLMNCQIALSCIQLVACFLLLPPPLTGSHILWLSGVVVPLLSISFFGTPMNKKIMKMAPGKNSNHLDPQVVGQYIVYFIFKFMPSVLVCVLVFALCLYYFCLEGSVDQSHCHFLLGDRNSTDSWNGWKDEYSQGLLLAQNLVVFLIVLYFVIISMSFVYPLKHLWKQHPFNNKLWCLVVPTVLLLQMVYFVFDMLIWQSTQQPFFEFSLSDIPMAAWLLGLLWPLLLVPICEIVKLYEIRLHVRYQKRAKLQFGTKLGMNSPF